MKNKYTLLIIICMFAFKSNAQLQNGGFENWTTIGSYSDPDHWYSLNYVSTVFGVTTCEVGTPGNPGAKYVKLISRNATGVGVIPGTLTSGEYNTSTTSYTNGFPFTQRPASLTGVWQYVPVGTDEGYAYVILSKWNTTTQAQDYIALATVDLQVSVPNWTNFDIPLNYTSADTPDSATIVFSSSGGGSGTIADGSYLSIDNLAFTGSVAGISTQTTQDFVAIFPNPAKQFINVIQANPSKETKYEIYNLAGKEVQNGTIQGSSSKLELNNLSKGIYILNLINDDKKVGKRFIVD